MGAAISAMRNLGPKTQLWLHGVGIDSEADLRAAGAVDAYRRLKFAFGKAITLNALYAMEAALRGCDWRALPDAVRRKLKAAAEAPD